MKSRHRWEVTVSVEGGSNWVGLRCMDPRSPEEQSTIEDDPESEFAGGRVYCACSDEIETDNMAEVTFEADFDIEFISYNCGLSPVPGTLKESE